MSKRPKGRPSQDDTDVVSDEVVLDAVLSAFGDAGFDGASMREIARNLDISHNLIPQRFGSKTDLWHAAVDYGFGWRDKEIIREGKRHGDDEMAIFRGLLVRILELNAARPSLLKIINHEAGNPGPRLEYLVQKYIEPGYGFMDTWMESLASKGRLKLPPPGLLYFMVIHGAGSMFVFPGLAARLGKTTTTDNAAIVRERAERIIDVFLDGLLPREGS